MAPTKPAAAAAEFSKDERVLCFHHEMLYEAKVLDSRPTEDNSSWQYKIHYKGWKNTWDDWVPQDRVRKLTPENKDLAAHMIAQAKLQQKAPKSVKKGGRTNGSDFSSARGSEERHASAAAPSVRGQRRNRDYDLEQVSGSARPELHPLPPALGQSPTGGVFAIERPAPLPRSRKRPVREKLAPDFEELPYKPTRAKRAKSSPSWSDPTHPDWDVLKFLASPELHPPDPLLKLPPPNYTYLDANGRLKNPYKYTKKKVVTHFEKQTVHPKLAAHIKNGTATSVIRYYYKDMPVDRVLPIAGIIHETPDPKDSEVRDSMRNVGQQGSGPVLFPNVPALTDYNLQEEVFHSRPSVKLVIPDQIKGILVDDWENVTKNQQLVPLPAKRPVSMILNDYLEHEKPKRQPGSAQADILEEVIAGLKEYFERCLGRILLYRFERIQYVEVREGWASATGDLAGKTAADTYGAEHLCRLLVSLPELIAQTNMDMQSVNRLREELSKLTNWLGRNTDTYFVSEYETPGQHYADKARGN